MLSRPRLLTSMLTLPSGPPRLLHLGVGLDDANPPHHADMGPAPTRRGLYTAHNVAGRQAIRPAMMAGGDAKDTQPVPATAVVLVGDGDKLGRLVHEQPVGLAFLFLLIDLLVIDSAGGMVGADP